MGRLLRYRVPSASLLGGPKASVWGGRGRRAEMGGKWGRGQLAPLYPIVLERKFPWGASEVAWSQGVARTGTPSLSLLNPPFQVGVVRGVAAPSCSWLTLCVYRFVSGGGLPPGRTLRQKNGEFRAFVHQLWPSLRRGGVGCAAAGGGDGWAARGRASALPLDPAAPGTGRGGAF